MFQSNQLPKLMIIVGILSLLSCSIEGAHSAGGKPTDHLKSLDPEKRVERPGRGEAWRAADQDLTFRFEQAYDQADEKRLVFEKYLSTLGAEAMLDFLEIRNPRCHGDAHDLGKALFAQVQDLEVALARCGNRCTNACMHGVVSEAFGDRGYNAVIKDMARFCEGEEMIVIHKPGNCAHGIGHGLMILTGHDIGQSLAGCSTFPKAGMDYYCATGVFMEYRGMLMAKEDQGKAIPRPRLHFPCDTYTQFPAACYRYMLRRIARDLHADEQRLVDECLGLHDLQRRGCFHGLGAMYSRTVAKHPALLPELCLKGNAEDQIVCIEGVIEKMADFDQAQAMAVCSILKGEHARVCQAGAREKMYRLEKPTIMLYRP